MSPRYTHLLPADIDLWRDYLDRPHPTWLSLDYDVRVGSGRDPGITYPDNIREMAIMLSQRRIDVVGELPDSITIIELSVHPGLTTLGQMIAYPILFQLTYNPPLPLTSLLICRDFQSDAETAFTAAAIPFVKVPYSRPPK